MEVHEEGFLSVRPIDYIDDVKLDGRCDSPIQRADLAAAELRYKYAFSARPWDNRTRRGQFMFVTDGLLRF